MEDIKYMLDRRYLTCDGFMTYFHLMAADTVRGCRNMKEYAAKLAREWAMLHKPWLPPNPKGWTVVRISGCELGCSSHSDYRQCLSKVVIDHETPRYYIGASGERVDKNSVVYAMP